MQEYNATVTDIKLSTPYLMRLKVKPDFPVPDFTPGQYFTLGLSYAEARIPDSGIEVLKEGQGLRVLKRPYSLSDPLLDEKGDLLADPQSELEFYIALVTPSAENPAPALTPRMFALKTGSRLFLSTRAMGHYTLNLLPRDQANGVIFCSTGTGEAPHNSMIRRLLREGFQKPIINLMCTRLSQDHCYRQEHDALMARYSNYRALFLCTRESGMDKAYIQDYFQNGRLALDTGFSPDPVHTHVFLCGNPAMVGAPKRDRQTQTIVYPHANGTVEILAAQGFVADELKNHGNVHFENYW